MPTLQELISLALERQRAENLLRRRRVVRHLDATHIEIEGRRYVSFAANDYLGLGARDVELGRSGSGASAAVGSEARSSEFAATPPTTAIRPAPVASAASSVRSTSARTIARW